MKKIHEKVIYKNDLGNSVEITYSFPFFLQELSGADGLDSVIHKTKSVNQDGYSVDSSSLQDRPMQIIGIIKAKDKDEAARYRQQLLQVFNPHIEGTLTYEYGNIKKKIRCKIEKAPKFSKKNNSYKRQLFSIELICPNPFFNDIEETKSEISTEQGNFSFPLNIPEMGLELSVRTISFISNIFNPGDVETPIKIYLRATGSVTNPIVENLNTGEFIKVKRKLLKGDVLEVNTEFGNKRVEIIRENGERENAFNYIDYKSKFFSLESGDNTIKYGAEIGDNNLDVVIYYTPRYLGV